MIAELFILVICFAVLFRVGEELKWRPRRRMARAKVRKSLRVVKGGRL